MSLASDMKSLFRKLLKLSDHDLENMIHTVNTCVFHLTKFFQGDMNKVVLWLNAENPLLGKVTPADMILSGRGEKLIQFIKDSVDLNEKTPV